MIKKIVPHLFSIGIMLLINVVFFFPQLQGEKLQQGDIVSYQAMEGEVKEFEEVKGEKPYWNNGMFSGMPWGLLNYSRDLNVNHYLIDIFKLGFDNPMGLINGGMFLAYLTLILLGVNPWLSLIGAVAFGLNINHLVLLEAGHNNKIFVLTYFPMIVGGLLLALKRQYKWGAVLFALGLSIGIYGNHIQMLYYLALALIAFLLTYSVFYLLNKKPLKPFVFAGLTLLLAAGFGAFSNAGQLMASRSYSEDTMRGAPILKKLNDTEDANSSSEVEGLEWNYAMNWSNGVLDLFSLLIPRFIGGSSGEEVNSSTEVGRLLQQNQSKKGSDGTYQAPMYWGELPFTSGPYYLGAITILLFVLSLFLLKPPMRWGFVGAILVCLLLSMGKNASWLNRTLFETLPLFNKFRAPNSIMNAIPIFFIIPAVLGLNQLIKGKNLDKYVSPLMWATAITGGFCLLMALLGTSIFSFTGPQDSRYNPSVVDIFITTRKELFQADSFRSLIFILLGSGLIWAYLKEKITQKWILFTGLGVLLLIDLWGVGKRYLDADNFVSKSRYEQNFAMRPVDREIKNMEPKGRGYYRVHDLSINTFNSSSTSKHHNTIGGYHAAKLQRYQDIIDYYISKGNRQVLNMLNAKYLISRDGQLQTNPNALGNAWFVDSLIYVQTPNEEIEMVGKIDPSSQAIVLKKEFSNTLAGFTPGGGNGNITLTSYEPDHLVYKSSSPTDNLAVFSEVWYGPNKGWKVTIDGEPSKMIRVNYLLRGLPVPAGQHEIIFTFEPEVATVSKIASISTSLLILLGFLGMVGIEAYRNLTAEAPTVTVSEKSASKKKRKKGTRKKSRK